MDVCAFKYRFGDMLPWVLVTVNDNIGVISKLKGTSLPAAFALSAAGLKLQVLEALYRVLISYVCLLEA